MDDSDNKKPTAPEGSKEPTTEKSAAGSQPTRVVAKPLATPPPSVDATYQSLLDASNVLERYGDTNLWSRNLTESLVESQKMFDSLVDRAKITTFPSILETLIPVNFQPQVGTLQAEIARLRSEVNKRAQALVTQKTDSKQKQAQITELQQALDTLNEKIGLSHLLDRVGVEGRERILSDRSFRELFTASEARPAFVISVDIRRSTELMLKAKEPSHFARFLMDLAGRLRDIILENYGVFDKFTGDGILGFFPEFFSGTDAGIRAVRAAEAAHRSFAELFQAHRASFIAVPKDAGLGIGIDFGNVQIVEVGGAITVVGTPVVYACRMSGAPARTTLLNYPAYHALFTRYSCFDFEESELDVKHEGKTLAYFVRSNKKVCEPARPEWTHSKPVTNDKLAT